MVLNIGNNERKIFTYLWNNADKNFTISEIAKNTGIAYGSAWNVLKAFAERRFVKITAVGKSKLCGLNLETEGIWTMLNTEKKIDLMKKPSLRQYFEAVKALETEIKNTITKKSQQEEAFNYLVIYGSIARGNPNKQSDIDILIRVIYEHNLQKIVDKINTSYLVDIKLTQVTKNELEKYLKEKREVYINIWREGVVLGNVSKFFEEFKQVWV